MYHTREVECTVSIELNELVIAHIANTAATKLEENITLFLNYLFTHLDATIRYHTSNMILHVQSDTSYMLIKDTTNHLIWHFYLNSNSSNNTKAPTTPPPLNGLMFIICNVLKNVVVSVTETEMAALFNNGQEVAILHASLEILGREQPAIHIGTDNSSAAGIINNTMRQYK